MKALVSGASGFTGEKLLKRILFDQEYSKVYALVRTELNLNHPKLEQIKVDFENFNIDSLPNGIEVAYCCIGTTIKKAQSKKTFEKLITNTSRNLQKFANK